VPPSSLAASAPSEGVPPQTAAASTPATSAATLASADGSYTLTVCPGSLVERTCKVELEGISQIEGMAAALKGRLGITSNFAILTYGQTGSMITAQTLGDIPSTAKVWLQEHSPAALSPSTPTPTAAPAPTASSPTTPKQPRKLTIMVLESQPLVPVKRKFEMTCSSLDDLKLQLGQGLEIDGHIELELVTQEVSRPVTHFGLIPAKPFKIRVVRAFKSSPRRKREWRAPRTSVSPASR
jgi:hypothetical protein